MIKNAKNKAVPMQTLGGQARRKSMSAKAWSEFCSAAAKARWAKINAEKAKKHDALARRRERDRARRAAK